jgi:hypothetical protein
MAFMPEPDGIDATMQLFRDSLQNKGATEYDYIVTISIYN